MIKYIVESHKAVPIDLLGSLTKPAGQVVSMAIKGRLTENGYVERLVHILKEEDVYLHEYCNLDNAELISLGFWMRCTCRS